MAVLIIGAVVLGGLLFFAGFLVGLENGFPSVATQLVAATPTGVAAPAPRTPRPAAPAPPAPPAPTLAPIAPDEPQQAEPGVPEPEGAETSEILEDPPQLAPVDGLPPFEATPVPAPELDPMPEEPVATAEPSAIPLDSAYAFQVGAFRHKENCDTVVQDLADRGYEPYVVEVRTPRRRILHAVRIGRYSDRLVAVQAASEFEKRERMATVVLPAASF